MGFDPFTTAMELGQSVIERIWPDANKRAEELRLLEELRQKGDLAGLQAKIQLLLAQLKVNEVEAKHPSIFVAGWRPFIGWIGGASLAYAGVIHPLMAWLWSLLQAFNVIDPTLPTPPYVESAVLGTIVTGMLGIGGMRSFDKKNDKATTGVSKRG